MTEHQEGLILMVQQATDEYRSGHERHRKLIEGLADRMSEMEDRIGKIDVLVAEQKLSMTGLERRKVEINNVRFTPSMVLSLLALVAAVVGGQKLATLGIADQQAAAINSIELLKVQLDARKQHEEDAAKLQDERATNLQRQITLIGGQVTMIDTKLSNLRETIAGRQ